jgi:F0F1-type ATP synthase assembly protein I
MLYLIAKALVSGVIIIAASETAKRSPAYGSLILSLPLISILAFIWLWRDTGDNERIASLAEGTFWLVLPTLPLFLVLPALLRSGMEFWIALAISCAMTIALYLGTAWLLPKVGINF